MSTIKVDEIKIRKKKVNYLNRCEFSRVEHFSRFRGALNIPCYFFASTGIPNAGADFAPIIVAGDPIGEPARIVLQRVVEVGPVHDGAAGALIGDGVCENDEGD